MFLLAVTLALGNEILSPRIAPVTHPVFSRSAAMAMSADGVLLAWSDDRGVVLTRDLQGEAMIISPTGLDPDLAAGRDGYLLVWTDNASLRAIRLDAHGNAIGSPVQLASDGASAPRVVHTAGSYHVLFGQHVYRVPESGPITAELEATPSGPWTSIATHNDAYALAGSTSDMVKGWCSVCYIPRYTVKSWLGSGAPASAETLFVQSRIPPSIACNHDRCLSVWYDMIEGIAIRPGDSLTWSFLGSVNLPAQVTDQTSPVAIAPYGDDFLVVWQERTLFGDSDVIAAVVPSTGRVGEPGPHRMSIAATPRNERRPSIGMLPDGRIVIAYEVVDTDGSLHLATRTLGAPVRRRTS